MNKTDQTHINGKATNSRNKYWRNSRGTLRQKKKTKKKREKREKERENRKKKEITKREKERKKIKDKKDVPKMLLAEMLVTI